MIFGDFPVNKIFGYLDDLFVNQRNRDLMSSRERMVGVFEFSPIKRKILIAVFEIFV